MSNSLADKLARKSSGSSSSKKGSGKASTKQVRLNLVYLDFWSVVKLSFLAGVCLAIMTIVAAFLLWTLLDSSGVFDQVNELYQSVTGGDSDLSDLVGLSQVMSIAFLAAGINLVVTTALGAVFAGLYNLSVKITGGLLVGFTTK